MITCPLCGNQNIEGADACEQCGQSLEFLSKPRPSSPIEHSILKDRVSELPPREPTMKVAPSDTIGDVLNLMVDQAVGCVAVVEGERLVGVFSERDALFRIGPDVAGLADRPVSEFMTTSPETIDDDAKIAFALHKMDVGGYRHLPVMRDDRLVGMISIRDIMRYIAEDLLATMLH